jgi:hypothetical protein
MLQVETLPVSLRELLQVFRPCFTAPTFRTFSVLLAGLIAAPVRRTVCGMLVAAGLAGVWHHSRAHGFFARARWCADQLGLALLGLIVDRLVPTGAPILVAIDDTLFRRTGRTVYATAWCHDGAARGLTPRAKLRWGNCWVVAGIVVTVPCLSRPVCLPVLARLWRTSGPSKPTLGRQLAHVLATALPDRQVHVVADSHYSTREFRNPPANLTVTGRVKSNAVFYDLHTPTPGANGRPRLRGPRLGNPAALAEHGPWHNTLVHRYGRTDTVSLLERRCLWYGVYRTRPIRVILLRDTPTERYDLALVTTDLTTPAEAIISRYAARWAIEVAFHDAKQITGLGEARNRTRRAVERTIPFQLITHSLITCWYALTTTDHLDEITTRRHSTPWYTTKTEPSHLDMTVKLRRLLIAARFHPGTTRTPTPQETLAVHQAWTQAAA